MYIKMKIKEEKFMIEEWEGNIWINEKGMHENIKKYDKRTIGRLKGRVGEHIAYCTQASKICEFLNLWAAKHR